MLVLNLRRAGERFYKIRKSKGLSRFEVAERADLSERTYADIERGSVNMRVETLLRICNALDITPDDVFAQDCEETFVTVNEINEKLSLCSSTEAETALKLLNVYLNSINK